MLIRLGAVCREEKRTENWEERRDCREGQSFVLWLCESNREDWGQRLEEEIEGEEEKASYES